jgi:hypothetical protein
MHIGKLIAALAFVVATAAHGDPEVGIVFSGTAVSACIAQADALAVIDVSVDDRALGQKLFDALSRSERCGLYTGVFTIDKVVLHQDEFWVLQVATLKDGKLFVVYVEPEEEPTETAQMNWINKEGGD